MKKNKLRKKKEPAPQEATKDLVEVVRCKDCKWNYMGLKCYNLNSIICNPRDDDYCSYGERKENI